MKAGAFLLALLWFSGATYAGYRLTARSFDWIDEPNFGLATGAALEIGLPAVDPSVIEGKIPPALLEQAKSLTPQQLLCLRASIAADRVQAVLKGDITAEEAAAAKKCLE